MRYVVLVDEFLPSLVERSKDWKGDEDDVPLLPSLPLGETKNAAAGLQLELVSRPKSPLLQVKVALPVPPPVPVTVIEEPGLVAGAGPPETWPVTGCGCGAVEAHPKQVVLLDPQKTICAGHAAPASDTIAAGALSEALEALS